MLWDSGYCVFRKERKYNDTPKAWCKIKSCFGPHFTEINNHWKGQTEKLVWSSYLVLLFIAIGHVYISGYTVTKTVKYLFSFKAGDIFSHSIALVIISSESAFKIGLLPSKEIWFICLNENLLSMKSAFYIILKALFHLKIFKFLSWLFGHVE